MVLMFSVLSYTLLLKLWLRENYLGLVLLCFFVEKSILGWTVYWVSLSVNSQVHTFAVCLWRIII